LVGIDIDHASRKVELTRLVLSGMPGEVERRARVMNAEATGFRNQSAMFDARSTVQLCAAQLLSSVCFIPADKAVITVEGGEKGAREWASVFR
jgi:hypothetical protein